MCKSRVFRLFTVLGFITFALLLPGCLFIPAPVPYVQEVLPFIWVPNLDGTVSKVNTETGQELGRYRVAPPDLPDGGSPSRTTVDLDGNCWVGLRTAGTVVKIGLYEKGFWIDRNGDGICQTSRDLNGDGKITGDEILPWGEDECVLYEVVLIPGHEGTYAPGTYPVSDYDTYYWGTAPRGLAIDRYNNLWAGTYRSQKYYYIDGASGTILKVLDVSPWDHHAYGAVIDSNGVIWSSGQEYDHVLRIDPRTDPPAIERIDLGHFSYGLALDYGGHLFVTGWSDNVLTKIDINTGQIIWTKYIPVAGWFRGATVTKDNNVWLASWYGCVVRLNNDGDVNAVIYLPQWGEVTGVAVDRVGKVWACPIGNEYIYRIDPRTNRIDLAVLIEGSGGHYSYSDMTGSIVQTITICPPGPYRTR
jgi:DNA-binding beta-propeller fold protein YncE